MYLQLFGMSEIEIQVPVKDLLSLIGVQPVIKTKKSQVMMGGFPLIIPTEPVLYVSIKNNIFCLFVYFQVVKPKLEEKTSNNTKSSNLII